MESAAKSDSSRIFPFCRRLIDTEYFSFLQTEKYSFKYHLSYFSFWFSLKRFRLSFYTLVSTLHRLTDRPRVHENTNSLFSLITSFSMCFHNIKKGGNKIHQGHASGASILNFQSHDPNSQRHLQPQ